MQRGSGSGGRKRGSSGRAGTDIELALHGAAGPGKAAAYHAVPPSGRGKGVLVLDESGALSDFARDACDRLARAGFAALAPDLPTSGPARAHIEASVRYLLDDHATEGPRIGALAFEEGAVRLLEDAHAARRIGCIVHCGGLPPGIPEDGEDPAPPLPALPTLLLFGEQDPRAEAARHLLQRQARGRLRVLPGAAAGFMNAARADRYAAPAAAAAWDEVLAFLEASL